MSSTVMSDIKPGTQTFGERMELAKQRSGLSDHDLAGRLGASHTTVGRWRTRATPSFAKIKKLAAAFAPEADVDAMWLAHGPGHGVAPTRRPSVRPSSGGAADTDHPDLQKVLQSLDGHLFSGRVPTATEVEAVKQAIAKLVALVAKRSDGDKRG